MSQTNEVVANQTGKVNLQLLSSLFTAVERKARQRGCSDTLKTGTDVLGWQKEKKKQSSCLKNPRRVKRFLHTVLHYTLASTSVVEPTANADAAQGSHDERKVDLWSHLWSPINETFTRKYRDVDDDHWKITWEPTATMTNCREVEQKTSDLWCHRSNFKIKKIGRGRVNPTIAITQISFSSEKLHFLSKGRDCVVLYLHSKQYLSLPDQLN